MSVRAPIAAMLAGALLAGCAAVGPTYTPPPIPRAAAFRTAPPASPAAPAPLSRWWTGFGDPALNALEDEALAQNLDLAAAVARVQQARAGAKAAGAALLPAGQLTPQVAGARQSLEGTNAQAARFQRDVALYDATAGASWELDLFGGLRRGLEAARADLDSADAGVEAARVMIAADVADAYLQLRGLQVRLALADRRVADDARFVDIVQASYQGGHAPRLQLDQAQYIQAQAEATIPLLRAGVEAELNRLAVLCGRPPESERGGLVRAALIPPPPGVPATLTPADLLARRPDVRAAERRLAASSARIGVAVSDYYPKVSLQGLLGFESLTASRLFTGAAFEGQLAGGLRWRLFDFGRVDAEVARARGVYAEQLAAYRQSVLRAAEDVENAVVQLNERGAQARRLEAASQALERAKDAAQAGYDAGATALLDVIDAERQLLVTQDALADARAAESRAAAAVFRAVGAV